MTDRKQWADQGKTPEDVAKLYSWANLQGAKYRDFSAERAQSQEQTRQHAEAAVAPHPAAGQSAEEPVAKDAASHKTADDPDAINVARQSVLSQFTKQSAQQFFRTPQAAQPLPAAGSSAPFFSIEQPFAPAAPENPSEPSGPPAWISAAPTPAASRPPLSQAAPSTEPMAQGGLQESRDRVASRWYALHGVFENANALAENPPQRAPARAPALALFSLAGGVGKTSLAATLGRALSAEGERVLLVDTAAFGLLPFYFGARDHRVGVLRTFSPPAASAEAPVQLVALEPESMGAENAAQDALSSEVLRFAQGASRVIVDLSTASGATARRILRLAPTMLVPLAPDMNSVVSVASIDAFFQHNSGAGAKALQPYYVLNQFDALLPLHLDVREALRTQLGERLLPFVIRHAPAVSEALAEGMTVIDYAPEAPVVEDFEHLANWLKQLAAPASQSYRGVRWSER